MKQHWKRIVIGVFMLFALGATPVFASEPILFQADNGLYGFENTEGEAVIEPIYLVANAFSEGFAVVARDIDGSGWPYEYGFIDQSGEEVIALIYQSAESFSEGFAVVKSNGLFGYIKTDGTLALPFAYNSATSFSGGQAVVKQDGGMQVISRPNLEQSNLSIDEGTYVTFTTVDAYLTYLESAFASLGEGEEINEEGMGKLEQLMPFMFRQLSSVEVQLEGETVFVRGENYSEVLTESTAVYTQLLELFDRYETEPSRAILYFLAMLRNGVGNPVQNGANVTLRTGIDYIVMPFPHPYFDPDVYKKFVETTEYTTYLTERLNGIGATEPNAGGILALQDYLSYSFLNFKPYYLTTKDNTVSITAKEHLEYFNERTAFTNEITAQLIGRNIELLQDYSNEILVLVAGLDLSKPIKISLESSFLTPYLDTIDGIRIVVGTTGESIYLLSEDLKQNLGGASTFGFDVTFSGNQVQLQVGGGVSSMVAPIFLSLPSSSKTASVYASIAGNSEENWGGLYKLNNTLEFATAHSGVYQVKEAKLPISDIDHLSAELQDTIHFMVSKGFFELEGENFNPESTMNRIEFIAALVKMFYAQDSTATSNFVDITDTNPHYALVSAAAQAGIASGYEGNVFGADNPATRAEVVSFLARTLASQKGYVYPENIDEVLSVFRDCDTIETWARENIALAVEHYLISTVGDFNGAQEIDRAEGAKLLETLFQNLYETADGATIYSSLEEDAPPFLEAYGWYLAGGAGGVLLVTGLVFVINKYKNKNK